MKTTTTTTLLLSMQILRERVHGSLLNNAKLYARRKKAEGGVGVGGGGHGGEFLRSELLQSVAQCSRNALSSVQGIVTSPARLSEVDRLDHATRTTA